MASKRLNLPDSASVANSLADGRLVAPSAARNFQAIRKVIHAFIPQSGNALEIASGTGEHILKLGHAFSQICWQPTDIDADRLESISAWQAVNGTENVLSPVLLDATTDNWAENFDTQNLVLLVNLHHLISDTETKNLIFQTAKVLAHDGVSLTYGPFKRGGEFISESDREFHQSLITQDPEIGYKSVQQIQNWQKEAGLQSLEPINMPANNLMLIARRPASS